MSTPWFTGASYLLTTLLWIIPTSWNKHLQVSVSGLKNESRDAFLVGILDYRELFARSMNQIRPQHTYEREEMNNIIEIQRDPSVVRSTVIKLSRKRLISEIINRNNDYLKSDLENSTIRFETKSYRHSLCRAAEECVLGNEKNSWNLWRFWEEWCLNIVRIWEKWRYSRRTGIGHGRGSWNFADLGIGGRIEHDYEEEGEVAEVEQHPTFS